MQGIFGTALLVAPPAEPYTPCAMPERIIPETVTYLWDLRSLCEQQIRALTDAQRRVDEYRDARSDAVRTRARQKLLQDLERVRENNGHVRTALTEAFKLAEQLPSTLEKAGGKK